MFQGTKEKLTSQAGLVPVVKFLDKIGLSTVVEEKAEKESAQLKFIEMKEYEYFCYVVSEKYTPWQTHKKYGERATSETWIEEAKNQMALSHIKTDSFIANAALFQCAILAYNTVK